MGTAPRAAHIRGERIPVPSHSTGRSTPIRHSRTVRGKREFRPCPWLGNLYPPTHYISSVLQELGRLGLELTDIEPNRSGRKKERSCLTCSNGSQIENLRRFCEVTVLQDFEFDLDEEGAPDGSGRSTARRVVRWRLVDREAPPT